MFDRIFGNSSIQLLEKALEGSSLRHKVISNNIANVNTPGYKRQEISFEEQLAVVTKEEAVADKGLLLTHPRHLAPKAKTSDINQIRTIENTSLRTDGNNVDIDAEMAAMTKNNIFYNTVAQRINGYYTNIKMAIKGG